MIDFSKIIAITIKDSNPEDHFMENILSGAKSIETRPNQALDALVGHKVALVRTGVKKNNKPYNLLFAYVTIEKGEIYDTPEKWDRDKDKHCVNDNSNFAINNFSKKYGYALTNLEKVLPKPIYVKNWHPITSNGLMYIARYIEPEDYVTESKRMKKLIIITEEQKNKLLKEYSTPDELDIGNIWMRWHNNCAYPFVQVNNQIVVGQEKQTHEDMKCAIISELSDVDEHIVRDIYSENYDEKEDEETGEIVFFDSNGDEIRDCDFENAYYYLEGDGKYDVGDYCKNYGRVWVNAGRNYETYVSLWLNSRDDDYDDGDGYWDEEYNDDDDENMFHVTNDTEEGNSMDYVPKSLSSDQLNAIKQVLDHFQVEYDNSYVVIGERIFPFLRLWNGDETIQITQADIDAMNDAKAKHNLPPQQKWQSTENFRQNRDKQLGKKLTMSNGKEIPMAQYHNMIYQEGKNKKNTF